MVMNTLTDCFCFADGDDAKPMTERVERKPSDSGDDGKVSGTKVGTSDRTSDTLVQDC